MNSNYPTLIKKRYESVQFILIKLDNSISLR